MRWWISPRRTMCPLCQFLGWWLTSGVACGQKISPDPASWMQLGTRLILAQTGIDTRLGYWHDAVSLRSPSLYALLTETLRKQKTLGKKYCGRDHKNGKHDLFSERFMRVQFLLSGCKAGWHLCLTILIFAYMKPFFYFLLFVMKPIVVLSVF